MKKVSTIFSAIIISLIAIGVGLVKFNYLNISEYGFLEKLITPQNEIPDAVGPKTMTIQYCDTCGTRNLYKQVQSYLSSRVTDPDFQLIAVKYKPSPLYQGLSYAITASQVGLGLSAFLFPSLFTPTDQQGQPQGGPRTHLMMLIFFGGNILRGLFTNSNAFEIYLGKDLVYSAIQNNSSGYATPPTLEQVVTILNEHGISVLETLTE
ncbi:Rdx type Selenoprotein [Cryptosporidium tyzzeri]|nr:Rdx type Selenoprotein [Cryptosporidium tyzzeri]